MTVRRHDQADLTKLLRRNLRKPSTPHLRGQLAAARRTLASTTSRHTQCRAEAETIADAIEAELSRRQDKPAGGQWMRASSTW